ncbi:hypothetical protein V498_09471 [Pseudogymnoascus sp. VKM F-4517 (FW-2822)]|nr:hypothetical protein V498_09471 [Pseudogymnoascus sp. VKM F-4517 (FW-2822)]
MVFAKWLLSTLALGFTLISAVLSQDDFLVFEAVAGRYKLAGKHLAPTIQIAQNDYTGVKRTANDLALDFGRVTGTNGTVSIVNSTSSSNRPLIIAGTIGKSTIIDNLISNLKIDVSGVKGKWEAYLTQVVTEPIEGVPWALVVAGNDQRGTIYGLYDISEQMGVSPWYWWADVPIKKKKGVWARETPKVQGSPSIQYRGIFLNDEAPALTGWAREKFGIGPNEPPFRGEFYKLVFELCLRLRSNYIWPAMWGSSFYVDDERNGQIADDYGIVIGTSHHEPMARSDVEQRQFLVGDWDWVDNKDNITQFFKEGVERAKDWETLYTMGMRGSGDAASPTLSSSSLEDIIDVQTKVLKEVLDVGDITKVPHTWVLYKEVGSYYQAGMNVPDDITLLWTDDNAGNLLRTPFANETDRIGGAGVYYHFDYVGSPRNYKWINTVQLVKTWEQMQLAYEKQARKIWIVNVGDLKALEIPTTHFLDMAYDMSKFASPKSTTDWINRWATREFGAAVAPTTSDILSTYGKLILRRKYELLSNKPYAYSAANYDELENVSKEWEDLLHLTQKAYDSLDKATQLAYYQMVLHPVMAGKVVVDLYSTVALNAWYAGQRRITTNALADKAYDLFAQDAKITDQYHGLNGGKWNHFASQVHIGYSSWQQPDQNIMPSVTYLNEDNVPRAGILGVSVQGSGKTSPGDPAPTLLSMDPYMPPGETRYLDIYARDNGTFSYKVTSNETFVSITKPRGRLTAPGRKSDVRCEITVDWDKAPSGLTMVQLQVDRTDGDSGSGTTAMLPVNKTSMPSGFSGHVESNGVISVEVEHYKSSEEKNGLSYVTIPHYGRTRSGIKLWPVTADTQTPSSAPKLTYPFYSFSSASSAKLMVFLGATLNHDPSRPLKYAFSIDDGEITSVQPISDTPMGSVPSDWTNAVTVGGYRSTSTIKLDKGAHELSLWLLEPGVVIQKIVIDIGGFKPSSLGPPESLMV